MFVKRDEFLALKSFVQELSKRVSMYEDKLNLLERVSCEANKNVEKIMQLYKDKIKYSAELNKYNFYHIYIKTVDGYWSKTMDGVNWIKKEKNEYQQYLTDKLDRIEKELEATLKEINGETK